MINKNHLILLAGWIRTGDWVTQPIEYKTFFHMLTGFAGTTQVFGTEETLRAWAGH
jgi:hypothetical protein